MNKMGPGRQRHGIVFATARGLTLGDTVARARHLYKRAFIQTRVAQGTPPSAKLPRLPVAEMPTGSGEISAYIQGFRQRTVSLVRASWSHLVRERDRSHPAADDNTRLIRDQVGVVR
jgi:hypothetical protein